MKARTILSALSVIVVSLVVVQNTVAQDEWRFGIGTGIGALSLDGDLAFRDSGVLQIDLSNSDTQDRIESGFGASGFAVKGNWKILYALGTMTLEDSSAGFTAEWDRTQFELAVAYLFGGTLNASWGVLFGARNTSHEWEFRAPMTPSVTIDEDWTDAVVGLIQSWKFADNWSWSNRLDGGFGDSEGTANFATSLNWHLGKRWLIHFNGKYSAVEFETGTAGASDYYLYDVDETTFGVGFTFLF